MYKNFFFFSLLAFTGCSITNEIDTEYSVEEQTASTFILEAAQGYVNTDNYETPHTYLVDTNRNEVYVDLYEEPSGLTPEEIIKNADKEVEVGESIDPIFELESLTTDGDSFSLQYDSKVVEFTAISDSNYETHDGIRYTINSYSGIDDYIESFFVE